MNLSEQELDDLREALRASHERDHRALPVTEAYQSCCEQTRETIRLYEERNKSALALCDQLKAQIERLEKLLAGK